MPRFAHALMILLTLAGCGGAASQSYDDHTVVMTDEGGGYADSTESVSPAYGGDVRVHSETRRAEGAAESYAEAEMAPADVGGDYAAEAPVAPPSAAPSSTRSASISAGGASAPSAPRRAREVASRDGAMDRMDDAAAPSMRRRMEPTAHDMEVVVEEVRPVPAQPVYRPVRQLTAASVGDHDRRQNYLEYLSRHHGEAREYGLDMSRRVRFQVQDRNGRPVSGATINLGSSCGGHGRTHADGVWDYYPGLRPQAANHGGWCQVQVHAQGRTGNAQVSIPTNGDGQQVTLRLSNLQAQGPSVLDLAFVIDVTGSMEDELRYVNQELADIVSRTRAESRQVQIRVGAVFYRDRHDQQPLQRIPFTTNIQGFTQAMQSIFATGGGDYPEDLNSGLEAALNSLSWSQQENAAKVMVLVADAPPQRYDHMAHLRHVNQATQEGIRILPVAASGADRSVEFLFRAMGAATSTPYVYLTDDSGIGGRHMEADTDRVAVEHFSDLLTRVLISDLRQQGMHEPGGFGVGD